jgi:hypothetical protein
MKHMCNIIPVPSDQYTTVNNNDNQRYKGTDYNFISYSIKKAPFTLP